MSKRITKEKVRLLLDVLLASRDESGYVPKNLEEYCDMLNITRNITRALGYNNLYEGRARQKKKILFNKVDDELVDLVFNTNYYQSAKIVKEVEPTMQEKLDEIYNTVQTMGQQISFLYNELVLKK